MIHGVSQLSGGMGLQTRASKGWKEGRESGRKWTFRVVSGIFCGFVCCMSDEKIHSISDKILSRGS